MSMPHKVLRTAILLFVGCAFSSQLPALATSTVVNVPGTSNVAQYIVNPIAIDLSAGSYTATPIDPPYPGALYTAFSFYSSGVWGWEFSVVNNLSSTRTTLLTTDVTGGCCYSTASEAYQHAIGGTFTIATDQTVYFGVDDSYSGDNTGGVSILIQSISQPVLSPIDTNQPFYLSSDLGTTLAPDFQGGTLQISASGTIADNFNIENYVGNTIDSHGHTVDFSGTLTGAGGLNIDDQIGGGVVIFSNTGGNTYSGTTTVTDGTLRAGANNAFSPSSSMSLADTATAVLDLAGYNESINGLSGGGTVGGNVPLSSGNLTTTAGGTYGGVISGTGGFTVSGGVETLTGINTYTGPTTISGGTLALSGTGSIAASSGIADNSVFDLSATTSGASIRSLSGDGSVVLGAQTLTLTNANDTFAGVISGTGGLTITGGFETLTGDNTYTGPTTILGGTLALGSGVAATSIAGNIVNNGMMSFSGSGTLTLGGVISGDGGMNQSGPGTTILTGDNTYTGGTMISAGTLTLSGMGNISSSSGVVVNGVFDISASSGASIKTMSGNGSVVLGAQTLTLTNANDAFAGVISGTGGFTIAGGTETLTGTNTYTGRTTISAGTLALSGIGSVASSSSVVDNGAFDISGTTSGASISSLSGNGSVALGAKTLTLTNASGIFAGVISGTGGLMFAGGLETLTGTNIYTGGTTVSAGTLQLGAGGTSGSIVGDVTNNGTLTFDRSDSATFVGVISGTGGVVQKGSGTTILTADSTYTGGTIISAGTLQLGSGGASGSITGDVTNNGVLVFDHAGLKNAFHPIDISGQANFTYIGPSRDPCCGTTLGSFHYFPNGPIGSVTLGSVPFTISSNSEGNQAWNAYWALDGGSGQASTTIDVGVYGVTDVYTLINTYWESDGPSLASLIFTGSDGATYTKYLFGGGDIRNWCCTGSGVNGTSATNVYSANTNGPDQLDMQHIVLPSEFSTQELTTIELVDIGASGVQRAILDGVTARSAAVDPMTISGVISGSGSVSQIGSGTTILTANNTYTGGTTISAGTLQLGNGGTSGSIVGDVTNNGTLSFDRSDTATFSGKVSGSGSVGQIGSGTTILTANNTYTGGTTISAGTLQLGNGGASGSIVGDVTDNGTLTFDRSDTATFSGVISGSGGVSQSGSGTIILTASNTYTGGTTISAGTLQLGNGGTSGSIVNGGMQYSAVNIGSLGGTGATVGYAINDAGAVVGSSSSPDGIGRAFVYSSGTMTLVNISDLAGDYGANAINNSGVIVGSGFVNPHTTAQPYESFVYQNGSYTILTLPGGTTAASGINSSGTVAGGYALDYSNFFWRPWTWSNGTYTTLGTFNNGWVSYGTAINDNGTVVGYYSDPNTNQGAHAFIYSNGTMAALGSLVPGGHSQAWSISDEGVVAGQSTTASGQTHAVIFENGTVEDLGTLGGTTSWAYDINDAGIVVGYAYTASGDRHAFVFDNGVMEDLNVILAGVLSTTLTEATAINNHGQIVANGANGASYLLTLIAGSVIDNGTLAFDRSDTVSFGSVISGSGGVNQIGSGTTILTATNTYTGATTISAGTLALSGSGSIASSSGMTDNGTFDISAVSSGAVITTLSGGGGIALGAQSLTLTSASDTFSGVIDGNGSFVIGAGSETLTGNNTYTGGTTISAGTLELGDGGTTGSIVGDVANNGLLAFDRSDSVTFAGSISGDGNMSQIGSGTTVLTATNTYTGTTTVEAGTLEVTGSIASSPVTVTDGGTLAGTGTVGSTTVQSGGTLVAGPNPDIGALTVSGDLSLAPGVNFVDYLAPGSAGLLAVSGVADVDGTVWAGFGDGTYLPGQYTLITATGGLSGTFSALNTTHIPTGYTASLTYDANDVYLNLFTLPFIWSSSPTTSDWNTGANWQNGLVPLANSTAQFDATSDPTVTISQTTTVGSLQFNAAAPAYAINITGSGSAPASLTLTGDGITDSSSYAPTITITGVANGLGSLTFASAGNAADTTLIAGGFATVSFEGTSDAGPAATLVAQSGGVFDFSGTAGTTGDNTVSAGSIAGAGTYELGGNTLSVGALNTSTEVSGTIADGGASGGVGASLTKVGTGTLTLSGVNTYTGRTVISGGTLALVGDGSIAASSGVTDNSIFDISAANAGVSIQSVSGNGSVVLGAQTLTLTNANDTFAGVIGGTGGVTIVGGTETLSGANTYTGLTTVSGGALAFSGDGSIAGLLSMTDNGVLDISGTNAGMSMQSLSGNGAVVLGAHTLTLTNANGNYAGVISGTGSLAITGGFETLSGLNTYSGGTIVNGATLGISSDANLGNGGVLTLLNGAMLIVTGSGTFTHNVSVSGDPTFNIASGNAVAWTGLISDGATPGDVVVTGGGTFEPLNPANSYSGGTSVVGGSTIIALTDSKLGAPSGGLTLGDATTSGTLKLSASFDLSASRTFTLGTGGGTIDTNGFNMAVSQGIDGAGSLTKASGGVLTFAGTNTYTGGTTISGGALQLGDGGTTGSVAGNITDNALLAFNRSDTTTFAGTISGTGAVIQFGSGTTVLTAANSYTGGTAIGAGTLQLGNGGATGSIVGDVADYGTLTFMRSDSVVFGGIISGYGGVQQSGAGTLILRAASTYTGPSVVNTGTLSVDGSIASSSNLTVESGATLTGTGSVPATTINAGGTVSPGNGGAGTLHVNGNLALASGSTYDFDATSTANDLLSVTGSASLAGTLAVAPTGNYTYNQTITVVDAGGGVTGSFDRLVTGDFGFNLVAVLGYGPNSAFLVLEPIAISPLLPANASVNETNVASAIDVAMAKDDKRALFSPLASLSANDFGTTLSQLSGELPNGAAHAGFMIAGSFLETMLDPLVDRRGDMEAGASALSFLSNPVRVALNGSINRAPVANPAPRRPLTIWGAALGGWANTDGNTQLGTHSTNTSDGALVVGADYRPDNGDTVVGAAGSIGQTWLHVAGGFGSGHSDVWQVGIYGSTRFDQFYLSGSAALAFFKVRTARTVTFGGDSLYDAKFDAPSDGGKLEIGRRFVTDGDLGLTPYIGLQAIQFHSPAYVETTANGSPEFALAYAKRAQSSVTHDVGIQLDDTLTLSTDTQIDLHARAGWLHDYSSPLSEQADFDAFPDAAFVVHGASQPKDAARVSIGMETGIVDGLVFQLKAQSELSNTWQTYSGNASVGYHW